MSSSSPAGQDAAGAAFAATGTVNAATAGAAATGERESAGEDESSWLRIRRCGMVTLSVVSGDP